MRLESSIKELHDMFVDIAMLVENQVTVGAAWAGRRGSPGLPEKGETGLLESRVGWENRWEIA